jgi:hypothetical protein
VGLGDAAVGDASGEGEVFAAVALALFFGDAFAGEEVAGEAGGGSDEEAKGSEVPGRAKQVRHVG